MLNYTRTGLKIGANQSDGVISPNMKVLVGVIVKIEEIVNVSTMISGNCQIDRDFIFQHNKDPKQMVKEKAYVDRKTQSGPLKVMHWPPQSQELLWDHLDKERNKRQSTSKEEL